MLTTILTDIHAHVLPDLDDGPQSFLECERLLQSMYTAQIDRVFTTSHYHSPHFDVPLGKLQATFTKTIEILAHQADVPLLKQGAEIRLAPAFTDDIRNESVPTLGNSRYVLVEFPSTEISADALSLIYELQIRKFVPIMAHPERHVAIQKKPGLIDELRESGLLMQITANCLRTYDKSKRSVQLAWHLLETGKVHFIASDAHNLETRPPGLMDAYDAVAYRLGQAVSDQLMMNANAVWDDEPCQEIMATQTQKTGWLLRFRKSQPT